ncbi:hypothetical protein [Kaistella sp.]|uniref:hypothetical protein n=1 Tax=Kaistella sp. TaxID=2782235 RepID=UPI002F91C9DF
MTQEIENRINELKEYVDKQRELIIGINNAIENDGFRPSESQQATINYICQQGKWGLKEIERLEELKKRFE